MRIAMGLALLAVGCTSSNDGIDLTGMYQVTAQAGSSPCGTDTPNAMPSPYLKFAKQKLFGVDILGYDECMDAAGTMCSSGSGLYEEPISHGWKGEESFDSSSGTDCLLGYFLDTAILTGTSLAIEHTEYSDMVQLDASACTTAEAKKRGTSMTCEMHLHIDATKL